jgi:L-asparaginase II
MISPAPLVYVYRGRMIECIHRGHLAVVNHQGEIIHELGDGKFLTYARSAAKPLQAIPIVESGAADRYNLSAAEIALICASHNGETEHVAAAQSILNKLGLHQDQLQCGVHEPYHRGTTNLMRQTNILPNSLHNNCSGKHSGMLALSAYMQVPNEDYLTPSHPVQRRMLQTISDMSKVNEADIVLGVDGCGVPVFGLGIDRLALAYARLGQPEGLTNVRAEACNRIVDSIRRHPEMLAGNNRFDTKLIKVTKGRIIGKMGAEGVFAMSIPERGWGIVLKVEDGAQRALYPAVTEALKQLDLIDADELEALQSFHQPATKNWQGTVVGHIEPCLNI